MTITKIEIATRQLGSAIRLFLEGDHVSSLTLAGAAEEILGKLCERAGLPVAVDQIVNFHWDDTDPAQTDHERRKTLLSVLNGPRNAAKHANNPDEVDFDDDPDFALQMIMRAMPMARSLNSPPANEKEMVDWIRKHFKSR